MRNTTRLLPLAAAAVMLVSACGNGSDPSTVTAPEARNKGRARRLISDLLGWAMLQGASHAYLQVMKNNDTAIRLYEGLGFREQYEYWYRVKG